MADVESSDGLWPALGSANGSDESWRDVELDEKSDGDDEAADRAGIANGATAGVKGERGPSAPPDDVQSWLGSTTLTSSQNNATSESGDATGLEASASQSRFLFLHQSHGSTSAVNGGTRGEGTRCEGWSEEDEAAAEDDELKDMPGMLDSASISRLDAEVDRYVEKSRRKSVTWRDGGSIARHEGVA